MISYDIKSHNLITKLQICIIFLFGLWEQQQKKKKKKKTGTDISRIVFGIAASETWANGGQREYVKQGWKPEMRGAVWLEK
jgi:hypothetical protein